MAELVISRPSRNVCCIFSNPLIGVWLSEPARLSSVTSEKLSDSTPLILTQLTSVIGPSPKPSSSRSSCVLLECLPPMDATSVAIERSCPPTRCMPYMIGTGFPGAIVVLIPSNE